MSLPLQLLTSLKDMTVLENVLNSEKTKGGKTANGEGEEASKTLKWDPNTDSQFINYILIIM